MPSAIPDSDDDGDDISIDDVGNSPLRNSKPFNAAAIDDLEWANAQRTGSTERLRRDIEKAEQGLCTNSTAQPGDTSARPMSSRPPSEKPTMETAKRRHMSASHASSSQDKKAHRTKTAPKTYGSSAKRHLAPGDDTAFRQFQQDDQSGGGLSDGLPDGSVQADFQAHEPAVMFRDSGSTVVDNSSDQRNMMQGILAALGKGSGTHQTNVVAGAEDEDDEPREGSSLQSWGLSGKVDGSYKDLNGSKFQADDQDDVGVGATLEHDQGKELPAEPIEYSNAADELPKRPSPRQNSDKQSNGSPVVAVRQEGSNAATEGAQDEGQPTARSRKHRVIQDDNTDPLNSEDAAIGLPKKQYKPRPSRRRATQVEDGPIDYSKMPEKAAKAKRTKTTQVEKSTSPVARKKLEPAASREKDATEDAVSHEAEARGDDVGQTRPSAADDSGIHDITTGKVADHNATSQSDTRKGSMEKPEQDDDKIFVKPPKPTPKPKSVSKSKRSHTTIFEDHTGLSHTQRSPNLSQQQAARSSVPPDLQKEPSPFTQKKRRKILSDDEDDEDEYDELAQDMAKPDSPVKGPPPKKRGRGRPAKSTSKDEDAITSYIHAKPDRKEAGKPPDANELPKKRGRGRPREVCAIVDTPAQHESEDEAAIVEDTAIPDENEPPLPQPPAQTNSETSTVGPEVNVPEKAVPTPSPEKPANSDTPASTPSKPGKPGPASHSPIKSSGKVPLRVGLSKRSRIPPLLSMKKPAEKPVAKLTEKAAKRAAKEAEAAAEKA